VLKLVFNWRLAEISDPSSAPVLEVLRPHFLCGRESVHEASAPSLRGGRSRPPTAPVAFGSPIQRGGVARSGQGATRRGGRASGGGTACSGGRAGHGEGTRGGTIVGQQFDADNMDAESDTELPLERTVRTVRTPRMTSALRRSNKAAVTAVLVDQAASTLFKTYYQVRAVQQCALWPAGGVAVFFMLPIVMDGTALNGQGWKAVCSHLTCSPTKVTAGGTYEFSIDPVDPKEMLALPASAAGSDLESDVGGCACGCVCDRARAGSGSHLGAAARSDTGLGRAPGLGTGTDLGANSGGSTGARVGSVDGVAALTGIGSGSSAGSGSVSGARSRAGSAPS